ncbi:MULTISPECIES: 1,4-alpha-glucan branching protein GlgB [unclassified Novosphingobium]|uniref:1,4-alpha-glucan branching protein GlgB n=1 Tax=unclassified Novosphingobium TaxID=2644732 RepID=UPI00086DBD88|nr:MULTISPECIES: 1,4-alpha-glucan branching protein GlgB [unclassified Novosphingobium]MBN9145276.1 1,4-alpha-glucan branching protein GlgB [Novosphingobium sp.]MDR6709655.1 1,4-alpha-glucan branching enzyme [Novosphingobium sp. 1748]ODU80344.1 MAG: 1,4-alpha-glucan branching enzyme [Novosphingobium sp. SCN 63-17]OJX88718.1 MAG: 1,4-alpha-glucan branching enzyme [Novosphingobium sp. 63-713]
MKPDPTAIAALLDGSHGDPFSLLGPHEGPGGTFVRAVLPGAQVAVACALDGTELGELALVDDRGLFEGVIAGPPQPLRYRVGALGAHWFVEDAFSYGPVLGPLDDYLINEGHHLRLFDKLGAHCISHQGSEGVHFAVWAPNAALVSVVGDFNEWDHRRHPMRRRADIGVWEIFVPTVGVGSAYKYRIVGADGTVLPLKADPWGQAGELRPSTASLTAHPVKQDWGDETHREYWAKVDPRRAPISIYEVHAGSWMRDEEDWFLDWDAMAEKLIPYVVEMGFTHIEFLPIAEHPYDPSWGYQTLGLFAPSARFGPPEGFARFVDGAHRAGIGVLVDWVPAHFPTDAHGLARFDGTALYEHDDPRLGFHPDWNTAIYNFGRREVSSFLVNNALFWAERYHVDGLRVDAVASMLYRDYSRKAGEWIPNEAGGRENWEAVDFLRAVNRAVYGQFPGFFTVAEESTAWPGVTQPAVEDNRSALGFGFKWNMGFMHDTLRYMARDPIYRRHHHNDITFGLMYAFAENFVLAISHDEVVHGKGSLVNKMAGDEWQKFANLRAYYGLMWGYPGKKLLFMGQEFAQLREWSEERSLDWDLLSQPEHEGMRSLVRDLNRAYRETPALHARDCEGEGFEWLVVDDALASVFAWVRHAGDGGCVAVISNMTPQVHGSYRLPLPREGVWREIINTDATIYGGTGLGNMGQVVAQNGAALVTLPPLATIMLEWIEAAA